MKLIRIITILGCVALFVSASYADSIKIPVPPMPPVPTFDEPPEPPRPIDVEFVAPPPPSFIEVDVSYPDYWFYDDDRGAWFYYEKGRKPRYVKHHEWRDDGRHYYGEGKKWHKAKMKHASKKGWVKKHKAKDKVKVKKKKWYRFWDDD